MPTIDVDGKFSVLLGEATIVKNHCKCPVYDWFPDGHITVQPHPLQRGRSFMALLMLDSACGSSQEGLCFKEGPRRPT